MSKLYARRAEKRLRLIFVNIYKHLPKDGPVEAYELVFENCCIQHKRCITSMSHVTLQCQGLPFGPKWARRAERPLAVQSVRAGIQMLQGRHNGKLPEWELRFNPHVLPAVTTKRENGDYPDEVKGATGSARPSFSASGFSYERRVWA